MNEPIILANGEGQTLAAGGTKTTFKLRSTATEGRFSLAEYHLPTGFSGPPPHIHDQFQHAWYILEGTLQIEIDSQVYHLKEGDFAFIPRCNPHTFSNSSNKPVKMLAIDTPGGLETYYEELADAFPEGTPPDRKIIAEIQSRYDTLPAL